MSTNILSIASGRVGKQLGVPYQYIRHAAPVQLETYIRLAESTTGPVSAANYTTIRNNLETLMRGSGSVSLGSVTLNLSNVASYFFISNPSIDMRAYNGFYVTLNDGSKNWKALITGVGTGETYGTNKITNGDFSSLSGWNSGTGFSINTGAKVLNASSVTTGNNESRIVATTIGELYKTVVTINTISGGSVRMAYNAAGTNQYSPTYNTTGTKTWYWIGTETQSTRPMEIRPVTTLTGQLTNYFMYKVLTASATGVICGTPTDSGINPNGSLTATISVS